MDKIKTFFSTESEIPIMNDIFDDDSTDQDDWMTSYLDLITILLVFFVVLIAFAKFSTPVSDVHVEEEVKQGGVPSTLVVKNTDNSILKGTSDLVVPSYDELLYKLKLLVSKTKSLESSHVYLDRRGASIVFPDMFLIKSEAGYRLTSDAGIFFDNLVNLINEFNEYVHIVILYESAVPANHATKMAMSSLALNTGFALTKMYSEDKVNASSMFLKNPERREPLIQTIIRFSPEPLL